MTEGFAEPLVRVAFALRASPGVPSGWPDLAAMLVRWTTSGCAHVERLGQPVDLATLPNLLPSDLAGAELVVFHSHVEVLFPASVAYIAQ